MTRARLIGLTTLLAGAVAVNVVLWRMGDTTSLRYVRMLLVQQASADSWRPMLRGLDAWDSGQPIYDTVFFRDRVKFQYPPSSLLLPLALRSEQRSGIPLFHALNRVGLAATLVVMLSTVVLFIRTWRTDASMTGRLQSLAGCGSHRGLQPRVLPRHHRVRPRADPDDRQRRDQRRAGLLAAEPASCRWRGRRRCLPGQAALRVAARLGRGPAPVVVRRTPLRRRRWWASRSPSRSSAGPSMSPTLGCLRTSANAAKPSTRTRRSTGC